jgi:hypothetical protein
MSIEYFFNHDYKMLNCNMNNHTNFDNIFILDNRFMAAKERIIYIRCCKATVLNSKEPQHEVMPQNISLHSNLVSDNFNDFFCCFCNMEYSCGKIYKYVWTDDRFIVRFKTLDGQILVPENWALDFCLIWK